MTATTTASAFGVTAATEALAHWRIPAGAHVSELCVSENGTYLVRTLTGAPRWVLRLNRPGYHPRAALASEVAWVTALRTDGVVRTPSVVPTRDGDVVADLGSDRHAVMFDHVVGTEPAAGDLARELDRLGELTALLHDHARRWVRPPGFTRFRWDVDAALGPQPRWGRWQEAPGVDSTALELLARTESAVRARLAGTMDDRAGVGLIHADMRAANLLVAGDGVTVLDFDDCGIGWWMYDLAASLSFEEARPDLDALAAAWFTGYRRAGALAPADVALAPALVMLRRLTLLAWVGSHAETAMAASVRDGFADGTCALAEEFLAGTLLREVL